MDEYVVMMRWLQKLRYILINFYGFLRYGKHKIESFFIFGFVWVMDMQRLFTFKYLLSSTGNAPLIFHFELIFCFEAVFKNSFLICSFLSCDNIFTLVAYLTIKHIYIVSHVSHITNSFKQKEL